MLDSNQNYQKPGETSEYYTTANAVNRLENWYILAKERPFFNFIFKKMELKKSGIIVEIGGGAGIHGVLLREYLGNRYIHTDLSPTMVAHAKSLGLESLVVDGLATPFENDSCSGLFLIGTSTIIRSEQMRIKQFTEVFRILKHNCDACFITGRFVRLRSMHCIDGRDLKILNELGFIIKSVSYWGLVPGRLWKYRFFHFLFLGVESLAVKLGLGVRKIVIVTKP